MKTSVLKEIITTPITITDIIALSFFWFGTLISYTVGRDFAIGFILFAIFGSMFLAISKVMMKRIRK